MAIRTIEVARVYYEGPIYREGLDTTGYLASDHYTNCINLEDRLPEDRDRMIIALRVALTRDESTFRPFFVGTQCPFARGGFQMKGRFTGRS